MDEEWNETLRCPMCDKTGLASLFQGEDDEVPTVRTVPDGFKVVTVKNGIDFRCVGCEVAVKP
jgi:hypothetical protein